MNHTEIENNSLIIVRSKKVSFIIVIIGLILLFDIPFEVLLYFILMQPEVLNLYSLIGVIAVQVIMYSFLIYYLRDYIKRKTPIFKINFIVNPEKIEIIIGNKKYLYEKWERIKKVEIINERTYKTQPKYLYNIRFTMDNGSRDIKLYILNLKKDDIKQIIHQVDENTSKNNIPLERTSQKIPNFNDQWRKELAALKNFQMSQKV